MTEKSLGRGLSAFLDFSTQNPTQQDGDLLKIDVNKVHPNPFQPRQTFDEENLNFLAESIKRSGVLQPIIVMKLDDENYQLIAGERRLRASKIAGAAEIPAIVTEMSREDQLEVAIVENIQRENLNPLDEAAAYKRLLDEFNHTQEELSEILGKSRSHITNMLRLLTLPDDVKDMVKSGKLTYGHARALVGTEDAISVAHQVADQSLNVRQTEKLVKQRKQSSRSGDDCETINLAEQISSLIGLQSHIKLKGSGGILEINFANFEELDVLIRRLNG
ncbi:MAG: ParB/RepB/Spo0J family partition protein [Holosporaceae bacterium]|jgi:ParB family chromosome partitioning protein|nr:ParB/RepB/Spo0J family partition protein [Holosporaceae bacterium]